MPFKDGEIRNFSICRETKLRSYTVCLPSTIDRAASSPLVIMLHGGGSSSSMVLQKYDWADKAYRGKFILALPDACLPFPEKPASFRHNPRAWNDGSGYGYAAEQNIDDTGFIGAMIEEIISSFGVDPARIFVSGFSNGASMAMRAGLELSGKIAAIGPVSGHLWLRNASPSRPVPMIYIIGGQDPVNPLGGGYSVLPWGKRILKPPVRETIDLWLKLNGCDHKPELKAAENGVKITKYGLSFGCELLYYEVEGLGHVWPGGVEELPRNLTGPRCDRLNATDAIWEFFKAHPM
jgi:polyhydroxybutyrate depolymerase